MGLRGSSLKPMVITILCSHLHWITIKSTHSQIRSVQLSSCFPQAVTLCQIFLNLQKIWDSPAPNSSTLPWAREWRPKQLSLWTPPLKEAIGWCCRTAIYCLIGLRDLLRNNSNSWTSLIKTSDSGLPPNPQMSSLWVCSKNPLRWLPNPQMESNLTPRLHSRRSQRNS